MKISCTKKQKRMLIFAMARSNDCLFPADIVNCRKMESCEQCLEENIDWQIEEGDDNG